MKTLVLIPSRLAATRLPGKPLLKINGLSIISHVFQKAEKANIGEVVVATSDQEIIDDVKKNGGQAILTKKEHQTGTDRIYEALRLSGNKDIDLVMNLQGDEPLIDVEDIRNLNNHMKKNKTQLGTLGSKILTKDYYKNQNIVKVLTKENLDTENFPEALNFKRVVSEQNKNIYHHLGIYCYQVQALKNFTSLSQTTNELDNNADLRPRATIFNSGIDMAGQSYTRPGLKRGPMATAHGVSVQNTNDSAVTLQTMSAQLVETMINQSAGQDGDITVIDAIGIKSATHIDNRGSGNSKFNNHFSFYAENNHEQVDKGYGFYVAEQKAKEGYAFYDNSNSVSKFGPIVIWNNTKVDMEKMIRKLESITGETLTV